MASRFARSEGSSVRYTLPHGWLIRADQTGLKKLYDIPTSGLPHRLNPGQLADLNGDLVADLQKHGFESEM